MTKSSKHELGAGSAAISPFDRNGSVATVPFLAPGIVSRWAAVISAVTIAAMITRGSAFHQLAIGLLLTLVSIAIGLAAIELAWRLAAGGSRLSK